MAFRRLKLHEALHPTIEKLGFTAPTPIQEQAIPAILEGRDLIGLAKTGSGKTAAYLLPIITRLLARQGPRVTRVLILVPTRELAIQVQEMAQPLGGPVGIEIAAVFGGVGFGPQIQALRSGRSMVVATPGRLMDHMRRGNARLDRIEILVLDEADRMLDVGFLPDIRRIVSRLPRQRQTLLFSATMPREIEQLAHSIMIQPQRVSVGTDGGVIPAMPVGITHAVYLVPTGRKFALLMHLVRKFNMASALIFCRTKRQAEQLSADLHHEGLSVESIHGDRPQAKRVEALDSFKAGRVRILVATDIAARGLDVEDISHVINFDLPGTGEDYIHRVGRTARVEARGDAFSLVSPDEVSALGNIEDVLGYSLPRVTDPDFDYGPKELPMLFPRGGPRRRFGRRR
jgi:ATP-dependent RNA helicase RhlE